MGGRLRAIRKRGELTMAKRRRTPRPLGSREITLLNLYSNCQLGMTPQAFSSKWFVNRQQLSQICRCSIATANRWFLRENSTPPELHHLHALALMDFLLENYETIPQSLKQKLCPPQRENR